VRRDRHWCLLNGGGVSLEALRQRVILGGLLVAKYRVDLAADPPPHQADAVAEAPPQFT
jgi:hypothetical protein